MENKNRIPKFNGSIIDYINTIDSRLQARSRREYSLRLIEITNKLEITKEGLTPSQLLEGLKSFIKKNEMAESSFRSYKSAAIFWLATQARKLLDSDQDISKYEIAFEQIKDLKYVNKSKSKKTSATKLKSFSKDALKTLENYKKENGHRSIHSIRAFDFANANLLVGLRPIEWFNTSLASMLSIDENGRYIRDSKGKFIFETAIIVGNAKHSHGRGNGHERELLLHDIKTNELKAIAHLIDITRQHAARYSEGTDITKINDLFYKPLRLAMKRAFISNGYDAKEIPTIYSTRHQVVADFKASNVPKREIAAFFGHSSPKTHREHYGRKNFGNRGVRFRASNKSIMQAYKHNLPKETMSEMTANTMEEWQMNKR